MGVVIVGPSGSGKSTLWKMLRHALHKIGQQIRTYVMNPKSMPRVQLLGHIDIDTREWSDGVLTAASRAVVKEPLGTKQTRFFFRNILFSSFSLKKKFIRGLCVTVMLILNGLNH